MVRWKESAKGGAVTGLVFSGVGLCLFIVSAVAFSTGRGLCFRFHIPIRCDILANDSAQLRLTGNLAEVDETVLGIKHYRPVWIIAAWVFILLIAIDLLTQILLITLKLWQGSSEPVSRNNYIMAFVGHGLLGCFGGAVGLIASHYSLFFKYCHPVNLMDAECRIAPITIRSFLWGALVCLGNGLTGLLHGRLLLSFVRSQHEAAAKLEKEALKQKEGVETAKTPAHHLPPLLTTPNHLSPGPSPDQATPGSVYPTSSTISINTGLDDTTNTYSTSNLVDTDEPTSSLNSISSPDTQHTTPTPNTPSISNPFPA